MGWAASLTDKYSDDDNKPILSAYRFEYFMDDLVYDNLYEMHPPDYETHDDNKIKDAFDLGFHVAMEQVCKAVNKRKEAMVRALQEEIKEKKDDETV